MTDTARLAALEAVAEAARLLDRFPPGVPGDGRIVRRADLAAVWDALDALDALPAPAPQPAGEVVEVRAGVYWDRASGSFSLNGIRWPDGQITVTQSDNLIATLTAHVPLPTVPVIAATVERGE